MVHDPSNENDSEESQMSRNRRQQPWTHARWGSVLLLPKAPFICSQGAVIEPVFLKSLPWASIYAGGHRCPHRETQSHSGDLILGGKCTKPKVNKPNDERSAMKAIHECHGREKGSILDRRVRKRKPEALVFNLRLIECENWGCGSEGRDHEQTPGWEKRSAVLGTWTQMAGLRLGRGRGRWSEKWVRRALSGCWGPQWGFEASSREPTWSDAFWKDCRCHEVIDDSVRICRPKSLSVAEETTQALGNYFSSQGEPGVGS